MTILFKFTAELESDKPFVDEELLAHARICVSKVTSDFKASNAKLNNFESGASSAERKVEETEKELSSLREQLQQNEVTRLSYEAKISELKTQVQKLEEDVTTLNVKLAGSSGDSSQAVKELELMLQKKNEHIQENMVSLT